jgi:hypothetical protein
VTPADGTRPLISAACPTCGEPVFADQGYYSITGEHWACHAKQVATVAELTKDRVRRRRRPDGEGKLAVRVRTLAVAALEQAIGVPLSDVTMWNQQGGYRGHHWDLDAWGLDFKFTLDGHQCAGSASSLSTMTQCARACSEGERFVAEADGDMAHAYSLYTRDPQIVRSLASSE